MSHEKPLFAPSAPIDLSPVKNMREDLADLIKGNLKQILVDALADKIGHAYAVASGRHHFRDAFMKGMGAFFNGNRGQCDDLADIAFQFLSTQWRLKYPGEDCTTFLDSVEPVSPPTQAEIDAAWTVQIESSEEAMQRHYVGSARTRTGEDAFNAFWHRDPSERKH